MMEKANDRFSTHHFKTEKTGRYVTYGNLSADTRYFWFVLHGTRMLCEQMAYKFRDFDHREHFVVAPEGLSRFYANGFGGDVVATWMTSRDRLFEIQDNNHYLYNLYHNFSVNLPSGCQKIILGFSQGGTTAYWPTMAITGWTDPGCKSYSSNFMVKGNFIAKVEM